MNISGGKKERIYTCVHIKATIFVHIQSEQKRIENEKFKFFPALFLSAVAIFLWSSLGCLCCSGQRFEPTRDETRNAIFILFSSHAPPLNCQRFAEEEVERKK